MSLVGLLIGWSILIYLLLFSIFWFARTAKMILFYLYLWQLKEYHMGRFVDHFRTDKGRSLLFNRLTVVKILFLLAFITLLWLPIFDPLSDTPDLFGYILLFMLPAVAILLLTVYFTEAKKTILDYRRKTLILPIFTKKIALLLLAVISFELAVLLFLFSRTGLSIISSLLLIDILTPALTSMTVLMVQPFVVVGRNRILQRAREKRKRMKNLKVIGITGSYGKTTTKEILAHILLQKYNVLKTPEHANSEVGISQTILRSLTDEHSIFVCEMGAYNKGGITLLAGIAKPDIGIVTGANEQHLATFGSMENLLSAEGGEELIKALPKGGTVIANGSSKVLAERKEKLEKLGKSIQWISKNDRTKLWTEDIIAEKNDISCILHDSDKNSERVRIPILGAHNVENILLAVQAAREVGMSFGEIVEALRTLPRDISPIQIRKGVNELNIADSSHSANPSGVIADLEYLKTWKGRKVIIMPCLIELGKASKDVHERIGRKIGEVCDVAIITSRECFEDLKKGALGNGMTEEQILFREKPKEIFDMIKNMNKEEDIILLESRVSKQLVDLLFKC